VIFPENFEKKIGFDAIRQLLKTHCLCNLGEKYVDGIEFRQDVSIIEKLLEQTDEFRQILIFEETFPSYNFIDLTSELSRLSVEGTFIQTEKLFDLKCSYSTIGDCVNFIEKLNPEKYPQIIAIGLKINFFKNILVKIDSIIDERGIIKDNASDELKKIRKEFISKQISIDKKIKTILQDLKKDSIVPGDAEITIRSGRMVLPIPASNKRKLRGFIHDESATGQTVYIEPSEILELNNDLRDLENAEKREIVKILTNFTNEFRPFFPELIESYKILGLFDFIRAKAMLAIDIGAFKPAIIDKPILIWYTAFNPLLHLLLKKQNKKVVPFDIMLGEEKKILIISGPNAGGKSVCLKSVGLIQYMVQCGLLVTLKEYSQVGIFKNLFIEIGDEQSLENDLSTYSSHLMNMKFLLENADNKSLFLIDEMGSGTEPQVGGAIAESVIEKLLLKNAVGVITTHYTNIKLMAGKNNAIVNGAMLYDLKNLKPLYKLKQGNPGSSFAFEIARNIGFDIDVLDNAAIKTGKTQMDFDQNLQQIETDKLEIIKKQEELNVADEFLSEMIDKYQDKLSNLEEKKTEIIKNAKKEAANLICEANKLIENTIREIKESDAEKKITIGARQKLQKFEEEKLAENKKLVNTIKIKSSSENNRNDYKIIQTVSFNIGDKVKIKDQNIFGEIIDINIKIANVETDYLKLKVPLANLEKILKFPVIKAAKSKYGHIISEINEKASNFKTRIDLRGSRADEVLPLVQKYIDDAVLFGVHDINILHGKGNGVLRKIIRDYLSVLPDIESFKDEIVENGGDGITIVKIK
jgi:DNA mismatch repair protein MutS2